MQGAINIECETLPHTYYPSVMSKISGPATPPSTAPTSPTSPTSPSSANGLTESKMGTGPDNQNPEWNEKSAVQPTGHYITQVIGRFHETNPKQILDTISLSPRPRSTGKKSGQQKTPLGRRPSIGKRMEGQSSYSEVRTAPARPCIR